MFTTAPDQGPRIWKRVYLAAQLLSEHVAKAVLHIFGEQYRKEAEFIALVDQAFDTFNFRHVTDFFFFFFTQ